MRKAIKKLWARFLALLTEGTQPAQAAAAVGLGLFIGIVPIYGLQTLAAIGAAFLFRLNKPLIVAVTFINNPLLQPFLVAGSVELGSFMTTGAFKPVSMAHWTVAELRSDLWLWIEGSLLLGLIVGLVGAAIAWLIATAMRGSNPDLRRRLRFVNAQYASAPQFDRGFVRWKMRLDRIFRLLAEEDLGTGTAVDLGCGYGMALAFAACNEPTRRIEGCDLDRQRIEVARASLAGFDFRFEVQDVRDFSLPPAGLILILDVLQYLHEDEQLALLRRCAAALEPQGKFIFRVHDRERGLRSRITMAFDRLIFKLGHAPNRPLMLPAQRYQKTLEAAGLTVRTHRFRNLLPLAHILFIAERASSQSVQRPSAECLQ
jgi:uncharacterized protein (DUF2062 family)